MHEQHKQRLQAIKKEMQDDVLSNFGKAAASMLANNQTSE
jgi:hypothetical protein